MELTVRPGRTARAYEEENPKDISYYLPLYRAVLEGDWDSASNFFDHDPEACTAKITAHSETSLHIAVGAGNRNDFVRKLLEVMPLLALEARDSNGDTALATAAIVGNYEAAKLLVEKNGYLPNIWSNENKSPLHRAAQFGKKEVVLYLLEVTDRSLGQNPYEGEYGLSLLKLVMVANFYDIAVKLIHKFPVLATKINQEGESLLTMIADTPSAFPSGTSLNIWQYPLYFVLPVEVIPVNLKNLASESNEPDLESQTGNMPRQYEKQISYLSQFEKGILYFYNLFWYIIGKIVCPINRLRDMKFIHHQVIQIVKETCNTVAELNHKEAEEILRKPLLLAAANGMHELVDEILKSFPAAIWFTDDKDGRNLFQLAIVNRHENIFSIIYRLGYYKQLVTLREDKENNNMLHMAGELAPLHQLGLVSGAALQMQRELQWFKAVELCVEPAERLKTNNCSKTPYMVFTEKHKDLAKEGEKWLKETASSCTVAASLIVTIVFAAAITVPGGNSSDNGHPIFSRDRAFRVFIISDAVSMFLSTSSVLMFLSILTSRYVEEDFLYSLPNRLIIGLISLFLSISVMMIAFTTTLFLVIGKEKTSILIPLSLLAGLPVTLFVFLQFPLLWKMLYSTYRHHIFTVKNRLVIQ